MKPLFGPPAGQLTHLRQIKLWTRELLAQNPDLTVMVSELTCTEPGCPPVETVIAVLGAPGETTQHKIHRPVIEVTREDIERLASSRSPHLHS